MGCRGEWSVGEDHGVVDKERSVLFLFANEVEDELVAEIGAEFSFVGF